MPVLSTPPFLCVCIWFLIPTLSLQSWGICPQLASLDREILGCQRPGVGVAASTSVRILGRACGGRREADGQWKTGQGREGRLLRLLCPSCLTLSFSFDFCNRNGCTTEFWYLSLPWRNASSAPDSQPLRKERPAGPLSPDLKLSVASDCGCCSRVCLFQGAGWGSPPYQYWPIYTPPQH